MALAVKTSCSDLKQDRMSVFYGRLHNFNFAAPLRHWKMDIYLEALAARRQSPLDILILRKKIWRSAYVSSFHDSYIRNQQPALTKEASDLLSKLQAIRSVLNGLQVKPENVAQIMVHIRSDEGVLPHYENRDAVETNAQHLMEFLKQVDIEISDFLNSNVLPPTNSSNRADHFISTFAETAAVAWRSTVSSQLQRRRDRGDFSGLLSTALDDFGYPRTGGQIGSDDWLYHRIGKFDIWK